MKDALSSIYKNEGLRGLFKGFYISLICQASAISFFFWMYFLINSATKSGRCSTKVRDSKRWILLH